MKTLGTLFMGGALFDIGARAAGYKTIWGIEKDDKVAAVARLNGFPAITADVIDFPWETLERPDHIHASPECQRASIANNNRGETSLDLALSNAVCLALTHFKPETFTLENVMAYRHFQSFKDICKTLENLGYWVDIANLNSADFGVPQTRERLWVRASRNLLRGYPPPVPWKGWYQAIEDLIPSLPDSEFAPWQMARLPEEFQETFITRGAKYGSEERGKGYFTVDQPVPTVTSCNKQRAFLFAGAGNCALKEAEPGKGVRYEESPAHTVASEGGGRVPRAFVVQVQGEHGKRYRDENEPMQTLAVPHSAGKYKAFVVGDQEGQIADSERRAFTVRAGESGGTTPRAFILDGQANTNGSKVTKREAEEPVFTVSASARRRPARACTPTGRVIKLDIRCLGRFQTVPDDYKGLTVKINGNGVPCLLAQKVMETLL